MYGFPSDAGMIDWVSDIGGTFERVLRTFTDFRDTAIQKCTEVPGKKPLATVKKAIDALMGDLQAIAAVAQGIVGNVRAVVARVKTYVDSPA